MAEAVLVDTDVISYLFRNDTRADAYRPYLVGPSLSVSFMTIAELDRWAIGRGWGIARRDRMEEFVRRYAIDLPDREMCRLWARVMDQARRAGRPIEVPDAWVAATAIALDVPLVTNNRADFLGVAGLRLLPESAV